MLAALKTQLATLLARTIAELYDIEHSPVIEVPPTRELGDLAAPAGLHLARALKRNPREIAAEIHAALQLPPELARASVEGPGYLNFFVERSSFAARVADGNLLSSADSTERIVVEHTNINPNKAAHIGHLRNAILGDVLASVLRALGRRVEVQNYIDDTGVQVADVVVGFVDIRGMDAEAVAAVEEPFDYYCWDLYSAVGDWFDADPQRRKLRRDTLHALEANAGERAEIGRLVARRIVHCHLQTMQRLAIGYDLITRESEILRLHFFATAFERLKTAGAVRLEESGKNAGCWVMPLSEDPEFEGLEDADKVITRSDGTVTYVGKDIAYQLWKFGRLGLDFQYRKWDAEGVWETAEADGAGDTGDVPVFGRGDQVINVIDARQSYLQKIVAAGLRATGFEVEADRSIHFAYEMVALSPAAAAQLGVETEDDSKATLMAGRKGIGVKADDLLDQLTEKASNGIAERNRELDPTELERLSLQIATAAMRFLMVKATTTRVIAFDFEDALNFEGETGPYLQYSLVREQNIRRRLEAADLPASTDAAAMAALPPELWQDDLWDLVLTVSQTSEIAERAADTLELSLLARHAIDLARKFHAIYHRHPILQEEDEALRTVRLATMDVFRKGLAEILDILGIPIPERM
ncbi:MAG: arginine--tRNA ligase [Acidobacteriota bacterium]|nr:arginine--tRNA ligase [Acidobacteriota bacterium]